MWWQTQKQQYLEGETEPEGDDAGEVEPEGEVLRAAQPSVDIIGAAQHRRAKVHAHLRPLLLTPTYNYCRKPGRLVRPCRWSCRVVGHVVVP